MPNPVYLDCNATTPLDRAVRDAMKPFFENEFGNPSSSHSFGIGPRNAVAKARTQVAEILNCAPEEIVFTSGGTESNNYAIAGTALRLKDKGNHIVTTQIEHPAILQVCRHLETLGFSVTRLPVDENCIVSVEDVQNAVTPDTILVTVMHANNEVGSVQPIEEIASLARSRGIVFHTDAAQSVGKIPADVQSLGVDMLSVAGHKIYAPKGVGALYIRKGKAPEIFMHGAGQEMGRRAGTENVMGIAGLGMACEVALENLEKNAARMKKTRDDLYAGLKRGWPDLRRNGHPEKVLPNTLSVSFKGLEADRILEKISPHVAASAGAACHSGLVRMSHVLSAMGISEQWAKGTIRFGTGRTTSDEDIRFAVEKIVEALQDCRTKS